MCGERENYRQINKERKKKGGGGGGEEGGEGKWLSRQHFGHKVIGAKIVF